MNAVRQHPLVTLHFGGVRYTVALITVCMSYAASPHLQSLHPVGVTSGATLHPNADLYESA